MESLFNKVADIWAANLVKIDSNSGVFLQYCKIFKNSFFDRTRPVTAFGPRHTFTMKLFLRE